MVGEEVRRNPNRVTSSSSSCSSSSSSYLSLSPASENGGECGLEGMELEAARALAFMSRKEERDSGGRSLKRFKNRSPAKDWETCNQGWDLASVPEDNMAIKVTVEEKISEIQPPSSNCSTNSLSCSGRKKKLNLTEVEKEARRMRRVLANRESARQTIRRRQALRDNLTKKVTDLLLDNQNMKMEKGQITKEYLLLRNKNKQLKNELAMAIACNIMGAEATSPPLETLSIPSSNSFLVNIKKPPVMSGICPPWPVIASHSGLCYDQNGSYKATEPQTTFSWFCTLLDQMSVSHHLMSGKWKDKEIDLLPGCSKATAVEEKPAMQDRTMNGDKSFKLDIDLNSRNVMPDPSSLDDLNHCSIVVGDEPRSTKFLDVSAAASARKRRKEILKLKHMCGF